MLYTVVRIGGGDYLLLAPASLMSRFNLPVIDPPRTRRIFIYSLVDAHPALSRPALCAEVFFLKRKTKKINKKIFKQAKKCHRQTIRRHLAIVAILVLIRKKRSHTSSHAAGI